MIPQSAQSIEGGFQIDKLYYFDPPITTRCIHVYEPREWCLEEFSSGICVGFDLGYYIFRGYPDDEGLPMYDFLVRHGDDGSKAHIVETPKLTIIQGSKM